MEPILENDTKILKKLGLSQIILFILMVLAIIDVNQKINFFDEECRNLKMIEREKRGAPAPPPPFTTPIIPILPVNASKTDMWVHSLSKIQVCQGRG